MTIHGTAVGSYGTRCVTCRSSLWGEPAVCFEWSSSAKVWMCAKCSENPTPEKVHAIVKNAREQTTTPRFENVGNFTVETHGEITFADQAVLDQILEGLKPPMIIGILGEPRSGKDTLADALKYYGYQRRAFADPVKQAVSAAFDVPMNWLNGDAKHVDREAPHPFWGISIREMIQKTGTEAFRAVFGDNFWIRRMVRTMNAPGPFVITDVRYENELEFVKNSGGVVVYLVRPNNTYKARAHTSNNLTSDDARCRALADFVIVNDQGVKHLTEEAERLHEELTRRENQG